MRIFSPRPSRFATRSFLALLTSSGVVPIAHAELLTVNIHDQDGPLDGSYIVVAGTAYHNGETLSLPPGPWPIVVVPGVDGAAQPLTSDVPVGLYRTDDVVIEAGQSVLSFGWDTATVNLRLVDQYGLDLPASSVELVTTNYGPGASPLPYQTAPVNGVKLPVNGGADAEGDWSMGRNGYDIHLHPGVNGHAQIFGGFGANTGLYRVDGSHGSASSPPVEITTALNGQDIEFEWATAEVDVHVIDQNGTDVDGSHVQLAYRSTGQESPSMPNQATPVPWVVLPVNDYDWARGDWSMYRWGYDVEIVPGVGGVPQDFHEFNGNVGLARIDGYYDNTVAPVEITANMDGGRLDFVWETATVDLHLVDQHGADIPEGGVQLLFRSTGQESAGVPYQATPTAGIQIPVNTYDWAQGDWSLGRKGFDIVLVPGVNGSPQPFTNFGDNLGIYRLDGDNGSATSPIVEVDVSMDGQRLDFEWAVVDVDVRVVDQNGTEIPGSTLGLYSGYGGPAPAGFPYQSAPALGVSLPISDVSWALGYWSDGRMGYDFVVYPGVDGFAQDSLLYRTEGYPGDPMASLVQVSEATTELSFVWPVFDCALDTTGDPVSSLLLDLPSPLPDVYAGECDVVTMPVTDRPSGASVQGSASGGYITHAYTDVAWAMRYFELDEQRLFTPDPFQVGTASLTLVCETLDECVGTPPCGDGVVAPDEECDDGNTTDGDGCTAACALEYCGDHVAQLDEECDEGPTGSASCDPDCTFANAAPVAACADVVIDADASCSGCASVDNGSSDAEGALSINESPTCDYPLGDTVVTLTATDDQGATDTCEALVTVVDTTPPTVVSTQPMVSLWPPNHAMRTYTIADCAGPATFADNCSTAVHATAAIISISSDEPDNVNADGDTSQDVVIYDSQRFGVRSERMGTGNGRVYTVTYGIADDAGNATSATCQFGVPHDKKDTAVDDWTTSPSSGQIVYSP